MAVDFEKIPVCVWKLFDEIMWANPAKCAPPETLTPTERGMAYVMCWGWNPPLIPWGSEDRLTDYGAAAYTWRVTQLHAISPAPEQNAAEEDDYLPALSQREWAQQLKRNASTLRRWLREGKIRCIKITPRLIRLHRKDFMDAGGKLKEGE